MKPGYIDSTEEGLLSPEYLPDYMQNSRRFRIEYRDPLSGFSNQEVTIYLNKDDPNIYENVTKIGQVIADSYGIPNQA